MMHIRQSFLPVSIVTYSARKARGASRLAANENVTMADKKASHKARDVSMIGPEFFKLSVV